MRKITRTSIALLGAVALTGVTAISASAVPFDDTTNATVEVTAGALTITAPATIGLAAAPGAPATATSGNIVVSDLTASTAGWVTTVSITDFTSANETSIPAESFSYTANAPTATSGGFTRTTAGLVSGQASGVATPVQTASDASGNNSLTWTADVSVAIPAAALAATDYTATLTHSVS